MAFIAIDCSKNVLLCSVEVEEVLLTTTVLVYRVLCDFTPAQADGV